MKYTITQLRKEFPTDEACLDYIFRQRYPDAQGFNRVKFRNRKAYVNCRGEHIYPLAGTIFEKSSTPLMLWFHAMFLFASSKNGVSAKELQRQLGVTYKTAWRMGHAIRSLMEQGTDPLKGIVEVDETYYGKGGNKKTAFKNKKVILGMVERKGRLKTKIITHRSRATIMPVLRDSIARKSHLMTDEAGAYDKVGSVGMTRSRVKHGKKHWVYKDAHTNTIEGFWGQFKRSVRGTYTFVSAQHLQAYLNEFSYRYNTRASSVPVFALLLAGASQ